MKQTFSLQELIHVNPVQVHDKVDSKFQLMSVASDRVVESRSTVHVCVSLTS